MELLHLVNSKANKNLGGYMGEEKTCACHTEEKVLSGECCKQKPNALDEFWKKLGDKKKKYVRSYRPGTRSIQDPETT